MFRMTSSGRKFVLKSLAVGLIALTGVLSLGAPAYAAKSGSTTNWNQRDAAVYVVSTLNLLRTHKGTPVSSIFQRRYNVTRYTVLDDLKSQDLYFIELKRDDGSVFGAYAYQMGWVKPQALTSSVSRFGARMAGADTLTSYRNDGKQLLATFTSTMPQ
jgi:hypothetical protein